MLSRIRRLLKHRWFDDASLRRAIPADMLLRLKQRVSASEKRHGGEIRFFMEAGLPISYLWRVDSIRQITRQRAVALFGKLRVWDTAHNNGVLIYLLLAERAIELVADRGLNEHVSPAEWQAMLERMRPALRQGRFEDGLTQALEEVTALLVRHFPLEPGASKPNELPDAPILG
jgi:uncharacterized membrane protein